MKTKIFAAYLPQYHETEDNNKFWGDGFTDWLAVKNAYPQFEGHQQPRIPLDHLYYDLSDVKTIQWQSNLARLYGIDGFNIYHYWFKDGKQELERPAELLLQHKEIEIEYFFSWDNIAWRRTWGNVIGNDWAPTFDNKTLHENPTLVEFDYGNKTLWEKHFKYLLPFFQDPRYLKVYSKPVFLFMVKNNTKALKQMANHWIKLAQENGFPGMILGIKRGNFPQKNVFDLQFTYEPQYSAWGMRESIARKIYKYLKIPPKRDFPVKYLYNYDSVWQKILSNAQRNIKHDIVSAFVRYDDTPRRGKNANIILNESPEKFGNYFGQLYKLACENGAPFLLLTAWNEWGEGAYLEPDERDGYAYLEALKQAINLCSESRQK